ncbi:hypothetical protein BKK51_07255 [Rodentibacter trehalosifermentans]|uniref:DUF805 domain-containing protein n=1 Tax=Rodentibacter trehalosifermentans TaxID=1908263 RepID=A0A1V3IT52_9PAST|nr:DUF805 domain-containing protein [Rodentibacter trehalosifermentans]OOF45220.1 hypothetical protein BKK51_07255 [Rodentibacter trehalosifermentans]
MQNTQAPLKKDILNRKGYIIFFLIYFSLSVILAYLLTVFNVKSDMSIVIFVVGLIIFFVKYAFARRRMADIGWKNKVFTGLFWIIWIFPLTEIIAHIILMSIKGKDIK